MLLSKKERTNNPTKIYEKSVYNTFMHTTNQVYLTKAIYQLHKKNGGVLNYIYFRSILPIKMFEWLSKFYTDGSQFHDGLSILDYLNKVFIKESTALYEYKPKDVLAVTSPSRIDVNISEYNDNHIITKTKKYGEMLAHDYGSIDVWTETSTEVTNLASRYNNKVPVWQRSMNTRHYSRDNEGYSDKPERSSLGNIIGGYGSDFSNLQDMKEKLYQKNNFE